MKSSLVLLFLLIAVHSFADDSTVSRIEHAVNTKNSLFRQEVFTLDNVSAFRVDAVKVTNLEKFDVTGGLKVVYKLTTGKEVKTHYNYIDADEIDGFITSLEYMKTILKSKTSPGNYTEIKYISRSGFQVMLNTTINESNKLDWGFFVQPDITAERSLMALPTGDVEKLLKTFSQGKSKL